MTRLSNRLATVTLVVATGLAVTLPTLAALYLAHRQSMDAEARYASRVANEVLRRAEDAGSQLLAAEAWMEAMSGSDPCSPAAIRRMQDAILTSSYVSLVGRVVDDRLLCSSLGDHGDGILLGPVAYVSSFGARARLATGLGTEIESRVLLFERNGFAMAVHPELVVDLETETPALSFGAVARSSGRVMSRRGPWDPEKSGALRVDATAPYFDGRQLVAVRASETFDLVAYSALPVAYLRGRLQAAAWTLVPVGALLGIGLAFVCVQVARRRASLAGMLRRGLRRRELVLHYQPICALSTGRVLGVEALLRWPQPDGSWIRPDLFIPAAEDLGLIRAITQQVIDQVQSDAPRLIERLPDGYVSINLASADLHDEGLVASLRRLISTPGIEARHVLVEATEHSFVEPERAEPVLRAIRALGIRVAIDDFGTGYSSLSSLTRLQTDYLKIDRAFIEAVGTDSITNEVALHIIRVADSLGLTVIAEGVETVSQVDFLRDHGVDLAQGWHFGPAMPLDEILERLGQEIGHQDRPPIARL